MRIDRIAEAFEMAARLHAGQVRRLSGMPFIEHPLGVARLVLQHGADEEALMAAFMHDGPEECEGERTLDEIRAAFGQVVAEIVAGCTDWLSLSRPKPPWRHRKEAFLATMRSASPQVCLVSCCDKLANCTDMVRNLRQQGPGVVAHFGASGPEELRWYYSEVVRVLRESRLHCPRLLRDLEWAVEDLHRVTKD